MGVKTELKRNRNEEIIWNKGDFVLRNGEKVEIIAYNEDKNYYDVRKPNGQIVRATSDQITQIINADVDNDDNDYYEPPKKRQKLSKLHYVEIKDFMDHIVNEEEYDVGEHLDEEDICHHFQFEQDEYKTICDELVSLKILIKDKKADSYKLKKGYKKPYNKYLKNKNMDPQTTHIVENRDRNKNKNKTRTRTRKQKDDKLLIN